MSIEEGSRPVKGPVDFDRFKLNPQRHFLKSTNTGKISRQDMIY